ncbi:hypothetical protein I4U23_021899 [Adineta vaga]|nr:hypothetical protein I4U23_021899 [Adineta vaga]
MRLLIAFTLLLVHIIFVQSKPVNFQLNDLYATYPQYSVIVPDTRTGLFELFNQLQLTNLDDLYDAYPEYLDLLIQLSNAANQLPSAVSPFQLNSLEQQALQVVLNIINGNADISTAVDHLVERIEQNLESNPQFFGIVQSVAQKLVNAALTPTPK